MSLGNSVKGSGHNLFSVVSAAVLASDDVFDVEGMIAVVPLAQAQAAVLTLVGSSLADQTAQARVHQETACCLRKSLALACRMAITLPACT